MRENDIRPDGLIDRYFELAREDATRFFPATGRSPIPCPGCGHEDSRPAFDKDGFAFRRCCACGSLFVSPRPDVGCFDRFYREGAAAAYWEDVFFPAVSTARKRLLFAPKARKVARLCRQAGIAPETIADVGAGLGHFLLELRRVFPGVRAIAVEPHPGMAGLCREQGLEAMETTAEKVDAGGVADLVTTMEVIEHVPDPLAFVRGVARLARPGGRVLMTGLCADGFDIVTLGARSRPISPPVHINFFSVRGITALCQRAGLEVLDVFTPGKLDVDIVRKALRDDPALLTDQPFLEQLFAGPESAQAAFQRFLARNRLSSHCWVWAAKPAEARS